MTAPARDSRDTAGTPDRRVDRRRLRGLAWTLTALALGMAGQARAQLGFSAALTSDYRYRGFSLSDGRPALTVAAAYDHPSGLYVGAAATGATTAHDGVRALGYQAYAGYAGRMATGSSWDVGVSHYDLTDYIQPRYHVQYSELYAGVAGQHLSAHLYYSPNYLGEKADTVYASVDGSLNRWNNWRLFGHLGVLAPIHPGAASEIRDPQYDLRAGAARRMGAWEAQVSVVGFGPGADYPPGNRQSRETLVAGLTRYF